MIGPLRKMCEGMRRYFVVFALLALPFVGYGAEEREEYPEDRLSEDQQISLLIHASERTTQQLNDVQQALAAFKDQEAFCIASPDNVEALYKLSERALKLFQAIRTAHIESYFRPAFLEEIDKVSTTAKNKAIPPICTP